MTLWFLWLDRLTKLLGFGKIIATIIPSQLARAWHAMASFISARARERRELAFLHHRVNHLVRDLLSANRVVSLREESPEVRLAEIRDRTDQTLQKICDEFAVIMSKRVGAAVHVSIGTTTNNQEIVGHPKFVEEVNRRCKQAEAGENLLDPVRRRERELRKLSELAGGNGNELLEGAPVEPIVSTRIRSKPMQDGREESSCPFWFIRCCAAHSHFFRKDPKLDGSVYCPAYDLMAENDEDYLAKNQIFAEIFSCPRDRWWKFYRSVAVFPLRIVARNNGDDALIGFLWLDSPKPRAFRNEFEMPGKEREWDAPMNLVHAVGDGIAAALAIDLFYDADLTNQSSGAGMSGKRTLTPVSELPPGQDPLPGSSSRGEPSSPVSTAREDGE